MSRPDIICLSTHYWHDFWFRKQHFMSRFHKKGHRILYVQPSFSIVRKSPKPGIANNKLFLPYLEKVDDNFYLFSPPRLLPKPGNPLSATLTYKWFSFLVNMATRSIGMDSPMLWVYRPEYTVGINAISYFNLVFDLADDLSAYSKVPGRVAFVASCIEKLAHEADQMIVTSPVLQEKYGNMNKKCVCIPNGFDSSLFNGSARPIPANMAGIKKPIIGFVGVLFSFLDFDLLRYIVLEHPDKSFVFVGPTEKSAKLDINKIKNIPNTYFLGRKQRQEIPAYVSNFDICLNPFKVDDVSRSVSPLKVYEYLASGKPVISTRMEGLIKDGSGDYIDFVSDKKEFSKMISKVLDSETTEKRKRRIESVKAFSWDKLFERVDNLFNDLV